MQNNQLSDRRGYHTMLCFTVKQREGRFGAESRYKCTINAVQMYLLYPQRHPGAFSSRDASHE